MAGNIMVCIFFFVLWGFTFSLFRVLLFAWEQTFTAHSRLIKAKVKALWIWEKGEGGILSRYRKKCKAYSFTEKKRKRKRMNFSQLRQYWQKAKEIIHDWKRKHLKGSTMIGNSDRN